MPKTIIVEVKVNNDKLVTVNLQKSALRITNIKEIDEYLYGRFQIVSNSKKKGFFVTVKFAF